MNALLAHCAGAISAYQPYWWGLFLGGLTGGFTHCLAMCSGFSSCRNACASGSCRTKAARWEERLNLAHHLGRMSSYGALGFLAALLARQVAAYPFWPKLEALLLVTAGGMFLASSIAGFMGHGQGTRGRMHHYLRGALLGFMPCGLIYAALMVVAASADPLVGFFGMVVFVIGTLPALWLAGFGVELLSLRWRNGMQKFGRAMMAFNGVALFVVAGKLVV